MDQGILLVVVSLVPFTSLQIVSLSNFKVAHCFPHPPLLQSRVWMPAGNPFVNYRWVDLNCCRSDDWTPDWSRSPETRATMRQALSLIPPELRAQYEASTEARAGQYTKHIADLVYYPRRMWETLSVELIPAFFTARVHSEVRSGEKQAL